MDGLLQGMLIATVTFCGMGAVAAWWVRHRLRRRLRIDPQVRAAAPTRFAVSAAPAARLHRRLRRVARSARVASAADPALALVADDLVVEALALEPRVLAVARTGRAGWPVRRDLAARISALDRVAGRLIALSAEAPLRAEPGGATRVDERLDALVSAREELAEIDLRAGLVTGR